MKMTFENVFICEFMLNVSFGHVILGLICGGFLLFEKKFFYQYVLSFLGLSNRLVHNTRAVKICQGPYNET